MFQMIEGGELTTLAALQHVHERGAKRKDDKDCAPRTNETIIISIMKELDIDLL